MLSTLFLSLFINVLAFGKTCEDKIRERVCIVENKECINQSSKYAEQIVEIYQNAHPVVKRVLCSVRQVSISDMSALGGVQILLDADRLPQSANIFIKKSVFISSLSADQMLSWKDQKVFGVNLPEFIVGNNSPKYKINTLEAIEYIITHEIGHIVDMFNTANKFRCLDSSCEVDSFDPYKVVPVVGSWGEISWENIVTPNRANYFPLLSKFCVYGCTPSLTEADITEFFQATSNTNFQTLYSMVSPQEDFAESFAFEVMIKYKRLSVELKVENASYSLSDKWSVNSLKRSWLENFLSKPLNYPKD